MKTQIPRADRSDLYEGETFLKLKEIVAENLKRIRQQRQWTQEEAAHQCGMGVRSYQAIEGAESNTTLLTLGRLVDGLGVSGAELLDPPKPKRKPRTKT